MESNEDLKQKQERFKSLGIPIPIEKPAFEQPVVNVKDPAMLKRIQEIKSGAKKGEFNEILSVGDKKGFQPLPVAKPKQKNAIQGQENIKTPTLENFAPKTSSSSNELDIYDKLFAGEISTSSNYNKENGGQRINEEINTDLTGTDFLNNFRQKLQAKALSNGASNNSSGFGIKNKNDNQISLNEIEKKIYEISSEVAKKISEETVESVLNKFLSKKNNLQENTFQKIKDDIIKIDNKYYKLTPVTIKQKQK